MSTGPPQDELQTGLSSRQKFWLYTLSVPCIVFVVLLLIATFLPASKPALNATEQQLLGHWRYLGPSGAGAEDICITPTEIRSEAVQRRYFWRAEPGSLYFQNGGWISRIKLSFGFTLPEAEWEIEHLDADRLELLYPSPSGKTARVFERVIE